MSTVTTQDLINFKTDGETASQFTNGAETEDVSPRIGADYPTLRKLIAQIVGLTEAPSFADTTALDAALDEYPFGQFAYVIADEQLWFKGLTNDSPPVADWLALDSNYGDLTALIAEITAARGGEDNLEDRLDGIDTVTDDLAEGVSDLEFGAGLAEIGTWYTIPVNGIIEGQIDANGNLKRFTTIDGYSEGYGGGDAGGGEVTAGGVENRQVPGPFSNRNRTHAALLQQTTAGGSVANEIVPVWRPLGAGPYDVEFVSTVASGEIIARYNGQSAPGRLKYATSSLLGGRDKIIAVLFYGQSLALGHKDFPPTPWIPNADPVAPYIPNVQGAAMFDSAAIDGRDRGPRPLQVLPSAGNRNTVIDPVQLSKLVSLRECRHADSFQHHETGCSAFAHSMLLQCEPGTIVIAGAIGTGSTAISEFQKGSGTSKHYDNAMAWFEAVKEQADQMLYNTVGGVDIFRDVIPVIVFCQGEQDNSNGTAEATYKSALIDIRDDFAADLVTAGITEDFVFHVEQTSQLTSGVLGMAGDAQADLMIAGDVSGNPVYHCKPGSSGSTHMYPATYMPRGSTAAYAVADRMRNPTRKPVHCVFQNKGGDTLNLTLTGGSGSGYVIDTDTIANMPDAWYGFDASDGSGALTVIAFSIAGTALTIQFNRAISGTINWRFGYRHNTGGASLYPNDNAPRVNIRDGLAWPCPMTGQIANNWMIQHQGSN